MIIFSPRLRDIIRGTYRSLRDRVEPTGYARTSLTGAYPGMYTRDSAIHALAMIETGDADLARAILAYLARYGAEADLPRSPQVVPQPVTHGSGAIEEGAPETGNEIMVDQPDGNYMFILAWARYAAAQPADTDFVDDTFAVIRRYADHYLRSRYWDPTAALLRNPNLEHSRNLRFWNSIDLITNVFLSQALYELAIVTRSRHPDLADRWTRLSHDIAAGIGRSLTVDAPDGRRQYAELVDLDHDSRFYAGYSWVNLATVAADWFAADEDMEAATYDAYLAQASRVWGSHRMLSAYDDVIAATGEDEVIGKGLSWELRLASRLGRADRVTAILEFIEERTTGDLFAESYYPRHLSDTGNQEQAAWFIYELAKTFPDELGDLWRARNATR